MLHDKAMFSLFSLTNSYVEVSAIKHFYSVGKYMTLFLIPFDLHLVYFSYCVSPHKCITKQPNHNMELEPVPSD